MRKLQVEELGRVDVDKYRQLPKRPLVVVCDNIRSAANVGAIFRTSDAFRVAKIYLCGISARPPHREIQKTALGATESVEWEYQDKVVDCLSTLKDEGYTLVGLEQMEGAIPLQSFSPKPDYSYALVLGNEVTGISDEAGDLLDKAIEIPQEGTKHSLNVSVAAGIALWSFVAGGIVR